MHTCSAPEDHVIVTCIEHVHCPQISKVIQMLVRWHADGPDAEAFKTQGNVCVCACAGVHVCVRECVCVCVYHYLHFYDFNF